MKEYMIFRVTFWSEKMCRYISVFKKRMTDFGKRSQRIFAPSSDPVSREPLPNPYRDPNRKSFRAWQKILQALWVFLTQRRKAMFVNRTCSMFDSWSGRTINH